MYDVPVHRCMLEISELALVQQKELMLASVNESTMSAASQGVLLHALVSDHYSGKKVRLPQYSLQSSIFHFLESQL